MSHAMSFVTMNLVTMMYLIASVCFIQALKGLSSPSTARRGNAFGMSGMAIAAVTTVALILKLKEQQTGGMGLTLVIIGIVTGGAIGAYLAKTVEMTKMPELVAAMHSLIGLAAVCIAVAAVSEPWAFNIAKHGEALPIGNRFELFIGTFVGAITFSGSVIAFGKLSGKYKFRLFQGAPVSFKGQHMLNLVLALVMVGLGLAFCFADGVEPAWTPFIVMTLIAFALGVLIIIPIGGADMPVVVSMLNSYSGWAAAGIGFSLNNSMLIIAGSLVGSSGAILSYIMCKAMNRSFFNVILGGFGGDAPAAGVAGAQEQRPVKSGSADDAAFIMSNAETVIIVPGYGLAVADALPISEGTGGKAHAQGHHRQVCDPPRGGAHAGPHERVAGRGGSAVRSGLRDGRHQRRIRPDGRGAGAGRERRGQPGGERSDIADRRHAYPGSLQGQEHHRQQALDGFRLCGPGQ